MQYEPCEEEVELGGMQAVVKSTHLTYKVAIIAPGASKSNTKVTIDTKNNVIFVDVSAKETTPKYITNSFDIGGSLSLKLPEQFKPDLTIKITDGIIYINAKSGDHIKEVAIG